MIRKKSSSNSDAAGILLLGMHRSGTSALSRVLGLCGADIGMRLIGPGPGNETGHWEDAFAVELHERLLARMGTSWDDAFSIPPDWLKSQAGQAAVTEISGYLAEDRSRAPVWAVKDPRLSLFACAWRSAAQGAGQSLAAVILIRHPAEVVSSLAARDGIAPGRGYLLWLDYTLAALEAAQGMPAVLLSYTDLLSDWRRAVAKVAQLLPEGRSLVADEAGQAEIAAFLKPELRHQRADSEHRMPRVVRESWLQLQAGAVEGRVDDALIRALRAHIEPVKELLHPAMDDWRVIRKQLWERVARAEAPLADQSLSLPGALSALASGIEENRSRLVDAISGELRQMQEIAAEAQTSLATQSGELGLARELAPRLEQLATGIEANRAHLVDAISGELRQMQAIAAEAQTSLAAQSGELGLARELAPRLEHLATGIETNRAHLVEAISGELRRMQEISADARSAAAVESYRADALAAELDRSHNQILEIERQMSAMKEAHASDIDAIARVTAHLEEKTREIAALRFELEQLRELAMQFDALKNSRSWRWTRPLRVVGRMLRGQLAPSDRGKIMKGVRGVVLKAPFLPDSTKSGLVERTLTGPGAEPSSLPDAECASRIRLADAQPGLPDVFVWAVIDWHFRFQRPQHLAKALAEKGHRVFYISNNFVDSAKAGFHIDPLDSAGRLFQIHLNLSGKPPIYFGMPSSGEVEALRASVAELLSWTCTLSSVSLVQHPYWSPLVRALPAARVVYDCMDHHGGFENNASTVLDAESTLVREADLVIVTSDWLESEIRPKARATAMVRNAGDFGFFSTEPAEVFHDEHGRRVIGYYGAIAEWFDPDLVRATAMANPDALVVLVGNDTAGVGALLADLDNVRMIGEVPYSALPYWLHGFNVCIMPFKVIPLTLATNPVKIYEYLSAGKPVVAVDLPEMAQFGRLVRVAADATSFVEQVAQALRESAKDMAPARYAFAAGQTWAHRALVLDEALEALLEPRVSVVVLTYNNLAFTEACLFSIEAYSDYRNLEVIVVDNASSDGSRDWLRLWAAEVSAAGHSRRLILNDANLGFSAGNNVGLRAASGEYIVILNNDTYVTPGWVRGLCNHLRERPTVGLIGPVTNNIGNEARIDIAYVDMAEMIRESAVYTRRNPGRIFPMRNAAFFCVAMHRSTFERVGEMDEAFGIGFFEDDDYCRRVEQLGLGVACAEDVFVHHHLSASFDALKAEKKQELFERNKVIYEAKWGEWMPHSYRPRG